MAAKSNRSRTAVRGDTPNAQDASEIAVKLFMTITELADAMMDVARAGLNCGRLDATVVALEHLAGKVGYVADEGRKTLGMVPRADLETWVGRD